MQHSGFRADVNVYARIRGKCEVCDGISSENNLDREKNIFSYYIIYVFH